MKAEEACFCAENSGGKMEINNNIKRGFVRVLWGVRNFEKRFRHRIGLDDHFKYLKLNTYDQPFTAFVFGSDNYKQLIDMGFNCQLVDERPVVWDMETQQFRHKLEALKLGMELFDEMVFLDWDTQLTSPLPPDFWNVLKEKEDIQASLRQYHRRRINWRKEDARKVPCAAFIYIRDKAIPDRLIKIWEELGKPWTEETVLMKFIDERMGGWKGIEEYWRRFEPVFFNLEGDGTRIYSDELLNTKKRCFEHVISRKMGREFSKRGIPSSYPAEGIKILEQNKLLRIQERNAYLLKRKARQEEREKRRLLKKT